MAKNRALVALIACVLLAGACEPSLDDLDRPLPHMATVRPPSSLGKGLVLATRTPTQTASTGTPSPTPSIAPTEATTYTVQAGDTLALIARKFGTSVERIAHASAITDVNAISVGQVLTLPHAAIGGTAPPVTTPTTTQRVVNTRAPALDVTATPPITYVVQAGDTLALVARRFSTTVERIALLSDIPDVNALDVGQVLRLPQEVQTLGLETLTALRTPATATATRRPTEVPTVAPTATARVVPPTAPPAQRQCCKYCCKGKACGDSCISRSYTCHKPPGCACNRCP